MIYKLYHGSSSFLSLRALKVEVLKFTDLSFQVFNADTEDSQKIFDLLLSKPLFVERRGIIIKRLNKNKDKERLLLNIFTLLQQENNGEDILFFWEDQKLRPSKYVTFFKKNNSLEEYNELNKRNFSTWLKEELQAQNVKMSPSSQSVLAQRTNYDPERCANEIKKFKLNELENIEEKDIEIITTDTLEDDIWGLIDSINHEDKPASIQILEKLNNQNNDPIYILSMLARNLRILTEVKYLNEIGTDFRNICSILRVPPFTLPQILKTAKQYDNKRILNIYNKLANLDYHIKTGKIDGKLGLTLICPYL